MILYYFIICTFNLVILTYQDLTNNRVVNDRFNWVCMGLALSLLSHTPHSIGYLLLGIPVLMAMRIALIKFKAVGEADINTFVWLFYGYFIINMSSLVVFLGIFLSFYLLKTGLMKLTKKKYMPLYPEILASWLLTNFFYGWFI